MPKEFNKENHLSLKKSGFQIVKEGWNYDGDVIITYRNIQTCSHEHLIRPDNDSYSGIVSKWESES